MKKEKILILIAVGVVYLGFATSLLAQTQYMTPTEYELLAPLPYIESSPGKTNTESFIPGLFKFAIAIAGVFAVIKIIWGGVQYMSTDAFTGKEDAKGTISNAIWGLLLAISAWLIVYTVNPRLVEFNLNITPQPLATTTTSGAGGPTAAGVRGRAECQGDCPYSYVNADGITVSYKDCESCHPSKSYGLDIKEKIVNGTETRINNQLGDRLKQVQNQSPVKFRVTELWPPTVNHAYQGHYDGTSVDVGLIDPTPRNIQAFAKKASSERLRVEYEVKTKDDYNALILAGIAADVVIKVVPRISAPHFSVYLR